MAQVQSPPKTFAPLAYELAREARDLAKARGIEGRVVLRHVNGATAIALVITQQELVVARSMGAGPSAVRKVRCLELVFDGPPWQRDDERASLGPRLLGIEYDGRRIRAGEWVQRDGVWVLRLPL